ncbi:hypothetical protein BT63DRAFT_435070 [Microthyrium microscopicum]|uniref:CipC-like antibiotic response protein n=1 Tax=Microthyrium microscopicum TaxID=703497 RepID=A0A6A6TX69_9PEZI|nr:hypothetical protein BT63DRAFT_435070 [Microthyrium microscopicum]
MFGWDESKDSYDQVNNSDQDTASFGHEALAGAAGFGAMKVFEDQQRKKGEPVKHQFAKELLAGFATAEVDKLAETKGEDWYREHGEKTKERATEQANHLYDQHYGNGNDYDPNSQGPPQHFNGYDNNY